MQVIAAEEEAIQQAAFKMLTLRSLVNVRLRCTAVPAMVPRSSNSFE